MPHIEERMIMDDRMERGGFPPVTKKEIFGWCCYDFANSAFTTVIITSVFSIFFTSVICEGAGNARTLWGLVGGISQAVVIVLSPWLGALADLTARKKKFLLITALGCSAITAVLFTTGPGTVIWAMFLVIAANICFSLGENFCASFLPEISTKENCGKISGYGWSFGYCGGLASLGIAAGILHVWGQGPEVVRWIFPMTGLFFVLSSIPTFVLLRERCKSRPGSNVLNTFCPAWREVLHTLGSIREHRLLALFLLSFFFFISGLTAVVFFASIFAKEAMGFTTSETILLLAGLQISSALGALGFGFLQDKIGSKVTLVFSLVIWIFVGVAATLCASKAWFCVIGCAAGVVIGSTQSASRAVISMLTPPEKAGEFFGFWGLFGKLGGLVGPLCLGMLADAFGLRMAVWINSGFFLVGLVIFLGLNLNPSFKRSSM